MSVQLNHTIVLASDQVRSATFLAEILGRPAPVSVGPFTAVQLDNDVTLDFLSRGPDIVSMHYAFQVSEPEFDEIFARIQERGVPYWADPMRAEPGRINTNNGGRGVYFSDPDDHNLEILTRP